jgi:hypothetical protein
MRRTGANVVHAGLWRPFASGDGNLINGQQNFSGAARRCSYRRWDVRPVADYARRQSCRDRAVDFDGVFAGLPGSLRANPNSPALDRSTNHSGTKRIGVLFATLSNAPTSGIE